MVSYGKRVDVVPFVTYHVVVNLLYCAARKTDVVTRDESSTRSNGGKS